MKNNKKTYICIGILIIVVIIIATNLGSKTVDTVKIGGAYNLTGAVASMGELQLNATKLAVEYINSKGGINGKKFEVIIEDTGSDAKQSGSAYQALKFKGVKHVIAESGTVVGTIRPIVIADNNFILTAGTVIPSYYDGNKLSCRIALTAKQFGPGFSSLYKQKGYTRAITLLPDNEYGRGVADEFKKTFETIGGKVILSEFYNASATGGDYRTNLTKIKAQQSNADAILYVQTSNPVEPMLRQMAEGGISIPVVSDIYTINNPGLKNLSLANNIEYVDYEYIGAPRENDSEEVVEFKKKYKKRYGNDPVYLAAAHYDAVILIAEAIAKNGDSPEQVADYISNLKDYKAITGTLSFNSDCEVDRTIVFRKVVDGKVIEMK